MTTVPPCARSVKDSARDALFKRLYRDHRAYVLGILSRRGVPPRDVEDVMQEVYLVAHRRLSDLNPAHTGRPWLHVIASYAALNYRRQARHRREKYSEDVLDPISDVSSAEASLIDHEDALTNRARVSRLRPKQRAVLEPYLFEGRTIPEIMADLKIPEKTAYARLSLARKALTRHR